MSQDAWIAQVRREVEESPRYRDLYNKVVTWQMGQQLFEERPDWFEPAVRTLADMINDVRVAEEAGRRYQSALTEWRYRQG